MLEQLTRTPFGRQHHPARMLSWRNVKLRANGVERNYRELRSMLAHPGVLACRRQATHHNHLETCIIVRIVVQRGGEITKIDEPAVGRCKRAWLRQAAQLGAILSKQIDPIQQFALISTDPPTQICLGEQRDMVEPHDLAGGCQSPRQVGLVEEPQRQPMMANELGHLLTVREWNVSVLPRIAPE